jgi:hypothetical protein
MQHLESRPPGWACAHAREQFAPDGVAFTSTAAIGSCEDAAVFAEGVDNIVGAMREAAAHYFADGSIELAVPPLRALLHVMRDGTWEGRGADDPAFRALFTREALLTSGWYRARLEAQRTMDQHLAERQMRYLEKFLTRPNYADVATRLHIRPRLEKLQAAASAMREPAYFEKLTGTLGVDPSIVAALPKTPA